MRETWAPKSDFSPVPVDFLFCSFGPIVRCFVCLLCAKKWALEFIVIVRLRKRSIAHGMQTDMKELLKGLLTYFLGCVAKDVMVK